MPRASMFRSFMAALRKQWRVQYPFVRPLTGTFECMPKASSFYAGVSQRTQMHVFLSFQPSVKSWEAGQFTVNVVLALDPKSPRAWGYTERVGDDFPEGPYRIGRLVGKKDKWWHLQLDKDHVGTQSWRPSTYADTSIVVAEVVDDVCRDVGTVFNLFEVSR